MATTIDELASYYSADLRQHGGAVPWVTLNMIASIDGAVSVDGVSGRLGGPADLAVFKTLRAWCDVVLVAAGTARAEKYRVPRPSDETRAMRAKRGQEPIPTIAIVTRSLSVDLDSELFDTAGYRPIIVTTTDSDAARRERLEDVAEVITAGSGDVDIVEAIAEVADRRGPAILAEGGPTLNGQLSAADVLDEVCATVSPLVVGGNAGRMIANGPAHPPRPFALDRAVSCDGLLFTRYLRQR